MSWLVDKGVWSLALRRDVEQTVPEVEALREALLGAQPVVTAGVVVQELLQGFAGPEDRGAGPCRVSALDCGVTNGWVGAVMPLRSSSRGVAPFLRTVGFVMNVHTVLDRPWATGARSRGT